MEEVAVPQGDQQTSQVDLCPHCGGVFLEFFDGEPGNLAREMVARLPQVDGARPINTDDLTCPVCRTAMTSHDYMDQGPGIGRCDTCLAAFATPAQLQQLASMVLTENPDGPPSLMQRLRDLLFPSRDR